MVRFLILTLFLMTVVDGRFLKRNKTKTDPAQNLQAFLKNAVNVGGLEQIQKMENVRSKLGAFRKTVHQKNVSTTASSKAKKIQAKRREDDEEPVDTIADINRGLEQFLFDGDIMLDAKQANQLNNKRGKRQAYSSSTARWPKDSPIPYYIDSTIDNASASLILDAVNFWQSHTCLSFKVDSTVSPRVKFTKGTGCSSYVGRVTTMDEQEVSIGDRCSYFGIIAHEIAHVLGIFHHQSRTDRDDFVEIVWDNIPAEWTDNLAIQTLSNNYNTSYEYGSVMHYAEKITESDAIQILAKDSRYQRSMGNRDTPTFSDVLVVNRYYDCASACNTTITCSNGGYQNPANCSQCVCPGGFGGKDCSTVASPEFGATNCGGILKASTVWQTLVGKVGENSSTVYPRQKACHWHIQAPAQTKISLKIDYIRGPCSLGCYYGSTEIKLGNFTLTGVRLCCSSDVPANSQFVTDGNLAVISAHTQLATEKFSIQYKILA
uniref:Zinc metalloproteinase n=1 Tax=Panagrolaimus sp. JU765 TaxID=591449 RepID=A0AC34RIR0_9BILA